MEIIPLLLVVMNCIEFSSQEAVDKEDFSLAVDNDHVLAVVDLPFNFSVSIQNVEWTNMSVEVRNRLFLMIISILLQFFWESNGVYVVPRSELGNKLVFSQAGPGTQMVELEANLVGIFNLKFYTMDEVGRKTFIAGIRSNPV